ncbi:MAG TPA: phospholipase D-like domain-containing protein [Puia sp.]|nr:phospholipase D-like domain-containing protein [Puia sp.]
MFVHNTNAAGFSVKAWIGDAKTLLAFNFNDKKDAVDLAGFTIRVQPHGQPAYYLLNKLVLPAGGHAVVAGEPANSTANAPIQKFRWLHVPGSFHQGEDPFFGVYTYTIAPRYFNKGVLAPLDPAKSVSVDVQVQPFATSQVALGFTRGFTQSQAFAYHFGIKAPFRPAGRDLLFDTKGVAGENGAGQSFTFEQEYAWSGFTAREKVFGILQEVLGDKTLSIDVFAYDLNEPDVCKAFLQLAGEGRMRIILDNASLHHKPGALEDAFEKQFRSVMKGSSAILRGKFGRFSHDKVIIVNRNGSAEKVLSGSTNFSISGMYVNANHVIVFDNVDVAGLYSRVFDEAWTDGVSETFNQSTLAGQQWAFNQKGLPDMCVTFSPHNANDAAAILNGMAQRIGKTSSSVLFAVMDVQSGGGAVLAALQKIHQDQQLFSYGITDNAGTNISLYRPGVRDGILVTGKPGRTVLPPPFDQEKNIGLDHQIHHKFIVCDFNQPGAIVWCGSSNLALGGEENNGDNLIHIKDTDIATVFAIEALSLVDHFDFRDAHGTGAAASAKAPKAPKGKGKTAAEHISGKTETGAADTPQHALAQSAPMATSTSAPSTLQLYANDSWAGRYFDPNDLHFEDRMLFA